MSSMMHWGNIKVLNNDMSHAIGYAEKYNSCNYFSNLIANDPHGYMFSVLWSFANNNLYYDTYKIVV